ncbi:MAG: tetraacyldisaccharide 4'-kinase [Deltaproteobacteria bacterium]|nr:tetraacyldisaccharide 4'-kinase [Deltaproteobacteria bacterium]
MGLYFLIQDLLTRPAVGVGARLLLLPLTAAGWLYGRVGGLRRWAYRRGVLQAFRAPVPVISVGNVTAGGTGKTPCVEAVCRILLEAGLKPAVLSRGYGGRIPGPWAAVSDGETVLLPPEQAGDEPVLLARRLPGVAVLVGRDRRTTAREAVARYGAEVLVLDDGFQHLRLARDLDIVAVDVTNPWGNGHCLPRGLLRERPAALADAGLVLLTRTGRVDARRIDAVSGAVRRWNRRSPMLPSTHTPASLVDLAGGPPRPVTDLAGWKVLAFAGIANPAAFFQDLEALGARVVEAIPFPDHHPYTAADVQKLTEWAGLVHAQAAVTTEKDGVRLVPFLPQPLPILALGIELRVREGEEVFRARVLEAAGRPARGAEGVQAPTEGSA